MYVWATEAALVFIFFCKSTTFQAEYKIIAILFILFKFHIGEVITPFCRSQRKGTTVFGGFDAKDYCPFTSL